MRLQDLILNKPDDFVEIVYRGGYSSNTPTASPTKELNKLGVANYGMQKRGDTFQVLKCDQEAKPKIFELVKPVVKKTTKRRGRKPKAKTTTE